MTSSHSAASFASEAEVVAASRERGEPEWLSDRRAEAARAFSALPMPTPALRPWRYTDVAGLDLSAQAPANAVVTVEGTLPEGGTAGPLAAAAATVPAVRERLGTLLAATEGTFLAANSAHWRDGALVHVPRAAAIEQPVIVTIDATAAAADSALFPRLLVVAEERSEVTIVLRSKSGAASLVATGAVEVFVGQGAHVRLLLDDQWGPQTQDYTWVRARLERDADLQVASLAMGAKLLKQTVEVLLEGEGARSAIRAVALGDERQQFDFVTLQDHTGPRTTSLVEVKAALAGASRSAYYGITRVGVDAKGADADQTNRNLLLSGESKADSDPVLEILTADVVRCGHHAAVGPVDQEALFYMQSRGLDLRLSLQLLVGGFFQSVVDGMPLAGLADDLTERVSAKLATATL